MDRLYVIIFILACVSLLASCSVYHPQLADIPLMEEKGELRVDAAASMTELYAVKANLTATYAFADHLAVQAFGSLGEEQRYHIHGALGCFEAFDNHTVIELYGGAAKGFGFAENNWYIDDGRLDADYNLVFTQLNYGWVSPGDFDIGMGVRVGQLHNLTSDFSYYGNYSNREVQTLSYDERSLLVEPVAFMRFGGEHVKVCFKMGFCWLSGASDIERHFPYHRFNFGVGINYSLGRSCHSGSSF